MAKNKPRIDPVLAFEEGGALTAGRQAFDVEAVLAVGDLAVCFAATGADTFACASYWGSDARGEVCWLVVDLGVLPFRRHDPELAPHDLAILEDPDDAEAYRQRADVYRGRGEYARALADDADVIRLDPGDAQALRERAW